MKAAEEDAIAIDVLRLLQAIRDAQLRDFRPLESAEVFCPEYDRVMGELVTRNRRVRKAS